MRDTMVNIWYQARLLFGWAHLAVPLLLAAALLLGQGEQAGLSAFQLTRWLEILVPLVGAWLAAPILGRDRDLGLAELQAVRLRGLERQTLTRYALSILYIVSAVSLLAWAAGGQGRNLRFLIGLVISVLPSLLFFSMLAMASALAAASMAAGFTVAALLWGTFVTCSLLTKATWFMNWVTPFPKLFGLAGALFLVNRFIYLVAWVVVGLSCRILLRTRYVGSNKD
ncbi:MAG: hypothetical protein K6U74_04090 [Firmicutes bacterium]|nr:hypothetical protein [Bacillota bacterium]